MRYGYKYHLSDGQLLHGEISASCREEAFQKLRNQGIKPMQLWVVESSMGGTSILFKSLVGFLILVLLCAMAYVLYLRKSQYWLHHDVVQLNPVHNIGGLMKNDAKMIVRPAPRKQLPALPSSWTNSFRHPSEVFLACYAQPGIVMTHGKESLEDIADDLYEALDDPIYLVELENEAVADLKRIVVGMKEDARKFLNTANGVEKLVAWLNERQRMEVLYRESVLSGSESIEEKNRSLRSMGLLEIQGGLLPLIRVPPVRQIEKTLCR